AFEAAVDGGGELPANPERLLPVVRRLGYRPPLRAGEPWHVELEDFATGWSAALDVRSLAAAMHQAWWLRWSLRAPTSSGGGAPAAGGAP
ncbi:MAG: hypothetical protein KC464_26015, partial [Myxococcales bacterium]|nr:hypothetical protein [Myxococcales bacterium]